MSSTPTAENPYPYTPSKALPIVFAAIIGVSVVLHALQNFYYRYWRITFFLFYAGLLFTAGWAVRAVSAAKDTGSLGLYIAQTILIYAAPPVFAAAEYNVLGRLMYYLPMHAPLHPNMVKYFFIYLGALVEALTGVGAGRLAGNKLGSSQYKSGGTFIAVALVLQGTIELGFVGMVVLMHLRAKRAGMLTKNVKVVCITLYGCSTLVLLRCVFRAVEAFTQYIGSCKDVYCGGVVKSEWYLFAFEAAPMVIYTFWFNILHPGRFLPAEHKRYLDVDASTERLGPGWIDERPWWIVAVDPFNAFKDERGCGEQTKFWMRPGEWEECQDGSFALGTASNRSKSTHRYHRTSGGVWTNKV